MHVTAKRDTIYKYRECCFILKHRLRSKKELWCTKKRPLNLETLETSQQDDQKQDTISDLLNDLDDDLEPDDADLLYLGLTMLEEDAEG